MHINHFDHFGQKAKDAELILLICPPCWIKVPPLGLACLASHAAQYGIKTAVLDLNIVLYHLNKDRQRDWQKLDANFENNIFTEVSKNNTGIMKEVSSLINNSPARFVGFSVYGRNRMFTAQLAGKINRNKKIILGGPEVLYQHFNDFKFFKQNIKRKMDYFVVGEGEQPLIDIVLQRNKNKIFKFSQTENLNSLAFIDFADFYINLYSEGNVLPIMTSRGCIKKCSFCAENLLFKGFRSITPERAVAYLKFITKKYKVKYISFHDSLINANLKWLDKFCSLLIAENLNILWDAQVIIRPMTAALLKKIKNAGCFNLFFGLESASDRVLKSMGKGFTAKDAITLFKKCRQAGLNFEISLIFGLPGERDEDYNATKNFILKNIDSIPKIAQANPYIPQKGTQAAALVNNAYQPDLEKISDFIAFMDKYKIKYTKAFINNLVDR